jgi:hypothetical protein
MEDLDIDGNIILEINGIWSENTYLIHMSEDSVQASCCEHNGELLIFIKAETILD